MIPPQHFPISSKLIKIRFACRFLRALKKLNKPTRTAAAAAAATKKRRYEMVKSAAYASMASAVGSKRAWSRALLWKIKNRGLSRMVLKRSKKVRNSSVLKKAIVRNNQENPSKAQELQKLVPGGKLMDFCSLLDETADYIKCLTFQVQIMRNIVDFHSGL